MGWMGSRKGNPRRRGLSRVGGAAQVSKALMPSASCRLILAALPEVLVGRPGTGRS